MNSFDLEEPVVRSPHASSECAIPYDHPPAIRSSLSAARRVEPAINHMLAHLNQPLRISSLSRVSGVSNSHFFMLFKSATGRSPNQFLIQLRMRRACELLSNEGASVKEVAHVMGYDDPFYFSRIFKLVTGLSPMNYRKKLESVSGKNQTALESGRTISPTHMPQTSIKCSV
jgi:AraC-like DNA-binding protein